MPADHQFGHAWRRKPVSQQELGARQAQAQRQRLELAALRGDLGGAQLALW